MRPHLPPVIARAIERATKPSLVFERAAIAANMQRVAEAARANGIRVLFAVKSFPHRDVIELAREQLDGFDVASPEEAALVGRAGIVSCADPTGRTHASAGRVIVSCETPEQAARRELLEETGLTVGDLHPAWSGQRPFEEGFPHTVTIHVFRGTTDARQEDVVLGEGRAMVFVPRDEVLD